MWLYAKNIITPDARTTASPTVQIKTSLDLVKAPVVNLIAIVVVVVVAPLLTLPLSAATRFVHHLKPLFIIFCAIMYCFLSPRIFCNFFWCFVFLYFVLSSVLYVPRKCLFHMKRYTNLDPFRNKKIRIS